MGFLDIGMGEILIILMVVLLIWGPGKIPEMGRTLGRIMRALKKASSELTTELFKEADGDEKDRAPQQKRKDSP